MNNVYLFFNKKFNVNFYNFDEFASIVQENFKNNENYILEETLRKMNVKLQNNQSITLLDCLNYFVTAYCCFHFGENVKLVGNMMFIENATALFLQSLKETFSSETLDYQIINFVLKYSEH